jgi:hypothetical protein
MGAQGWRGAQGLDGAIVNDTPLFEQHRPVCDASQVMAKQTGDQ